MQPPLVSLCLTGRNQEVSTMDALYESIGWGVAALAFFSFLAVSSWVNARRREREAYYKADAVKKIAEIQGTPSDPVLALLREALKEPPPTPNPWAMTSEV